jgi:biotin carboxylase
VKRLLLLLSAHSYRAPDFLAAARKLGVDLVIGTEEKFPIGTLPAGTIIQLDLRSVEVGLAAIEELAALRPLDAIVAVDDTGQALAAQASAALGIPSNPSESVVSAQNKRVFREICHSAGLPTPWFRELSLTENPRDISKTLRFPCVIKPLHLSASQGVIRAGNPGEFEAAFERVKAILTRAEVVQRAPDLARRLLVEAYLEGTEVALEGLVIEGEFRLLAFFDKPDPLEGPFFQETIYVTPSRQSWETQARAVEAVQKAVRALGLRVGPVHAEVRIHQGRATVLDFAPRSIGGHCGRALRFGHGLTLEELILVQALGLDPGETQRERPAAGVLMVPIPRAGILREVAGTGEARAIAGVVEVEILIPPGQWVEPPPEGDRYLGFVFARAGTPDKVETALRMAGNSLQVRIGSGADDAVR